MRMPLLAVPGITPLTSSRRLSTLDRTTLFRTAGLLTIMTLCSCKLEAAFDAPRAKAANSGEVVFSSRDSFCCT